MLRALALVLALECLLAPRSAHAFASTLRHGYTQCTPCHVDPSGSGTLSAYGRAVADEAIRMRFPGESEQAAQAAPSAKFFWGMNLPEQLSLQADLRYLRLESKAEGSPNLSRGVWMQADLNAALQLHGFTAAASIGYADEGALPAALTRGSEKNLVSRHHWLGYSLAGGALMLRAGRFNLPFGLRTMEHTLWARALTRTSINADQQYGVSAAYVGERFRAELMGIAGNLQQRPDVFRERGYSGYLEFESPYKLTGGVSSLLVHRGLDPSTLKETWRQVHGVFGRWGTPWQPLILMSEWDYSLESPRYAPRRKGVVGFLQADVEVIQGIHLLATGEARNVGVEGPPPSWGGWLSYAWFFAPHADLRIDAIYQSLGSSAGSTSATTLLVQGHLYL